MIYVLILVGVMGIIGVLYYYLFIYMKKGLLRRVGSAVDMVKVAIYYRLRRRFEAEYGEDQARFLAAAVTNELFSLPPGSPDAQAFLESHRETVQRELCNLKNDDETRDTVTQAIRVQQSVAYGQGVRNGKALLGPMNKLMALGILVPGGDVPDRTEFMQRASELYESVQEQRGDTRREMAQTSQHIGGDADTADVVLNFVRYCKAYLSERCDLSEDEAQILVLDPELGADIDEVKQEWLWKDLGLGTDPDTLLVPKLFDAPEMGRINSLLDRYASEYSHREERIKRYLKSIGHPLGYP